MYIFVTIVSGIFFIINVGAALIELALFWRYYLQYPTDSDDLVSYVESDFCENNYFSYPTVEFTVVMEVENITD